MDKSIYSPLHTSLASLLRQLREDNGLSQVDVATALGEPQSFVSKYETGTRRLDLVELRQVARVLGVELREIVARFEKVAGDEG